jgi:hypothetical protein
MTNIETASQFASTNFSALRYYRVKAARDLHLAKVLNGYDNGHDAAKDLVFGPTVSKYLSVVSTLFIA